MTLDRRVSNSIASSGILILYMGSQLHIFLVLLFTVLPATVVGEQILKISSFSSCLANASVVLDRVNIEYNHDNRKVTFDISGTSGSIQNVSAVLKVLALGNIVYTNEFNPCDKKNFVAQLCPGIFVAMSSTRTKLTRLGSTTRHVLRERHSRDPRVICLPGPSTGVQYTRYPGTGNAATQVV